MCFTTCKQKAKNANKFSTQGQKCTILEFLSQKMVLVTLYLEKMWKLIFFTSKLFLFKFGNSKNKTFLLLPHIKRLWQSKPLYNKPFNYWINCRMNAFLWGYVTLHWKWIFSSKWFSIWFILCVVEVYLCGKHFYGSKKNFHIVRMGSVWNNFFGSMQVKINSSCKKILWNAKNGW